MSKEPGGTLIEATGDLMQALFVESMRLRGKWLETLQKAEDTLRQGGTVTFENLTSDLYLDVALMLDPLEKQGYKVTTKTKMHGFSGPMLLDAEMTATKKETA